MTVSAEAEVAAVMERLPVEALLRLEPVDVLRLAMLLQLRRGELTAAAETAHRLRTAWEPDSGDDSDGARRRPQAYTVGWVIETWLMGRGEWRPPLAPLELSPLAEGPPGTA